MFFLTLCINFCSSECLSYSGSQGRISVAAGACLNVTNVLIIGLSRQRFGGAIYLASNGLTSDIADTTIVSCSVTEYGGALAHGGTILVMLRCCIRSTTATIQGSAIDGWSSTASKNI
jgi:hypothetical protein